ncbi:MAG: YdcF family protein [Elusimicrobia bacterium]|nr:YdcF family protein [Elusimicrobiota bacterium]
MHRRALLFCGALLAAAVLFASTLAGVGWWLDCGDAPRGSDIIVVLGGGFARPIYGADLYRQGLAPEVWHGRLLPDEGEALVRGLGVALPRETDVNHAILLKKGVPEKAIRLYGQDLNSTNDEAKALAREYASRGKTILLVTSRCHARRARLIFRRRLPGARVIVCPTPYETFDRRWWRHKTLTLNAVMEMLKLANYLAGSPFGKEP